MFGDLKITWRLGYGCLVFTHSAYGKAWTEKVRVSQMYNNIWQVHSGNVRAESTVDWVTVCKLTCGGYFVIPPPKCHLIVFGKFDDDFPKSGGLILPGQSARMGYRKLPFMAEHRAFEGGYFFESL